ncbi:MAG: hypothetical protein M0C28_01170 [Candidatus Moduliflexus flocculans]|nr:hypothetical protein [Candidatus Moduliflexus flocculans]
MEAFDIKGNEYMGTAAEDADSPAESDDFSPGPKTLDGVTGGMDQDRPISSGRNIRCHSEHLDKRQSLPEKSFYSGSVVFNGLILVLCGAEAGDRQTSILAYDPQRDQWGQATPLPLCDQTDRIHHQRERIVCGGRMRSRPSRL